jgi:hypothetical protein
MRAGWAAGLLVFVSSFARAATLREPILGASVESRYDSNAGTGHADALGVFSPTVGYRQRHEVGHVELSYAPELIQHLRGGHVAWGHLANASFEERLSRRLTVDAAGAFWRVEDSTLLPRFGVTRVPAPALYTWGELETRYRLTHADTVEARYRGEASRLYLDDRPLGADHGFSAGWLHTLDRRLQIGARYRFVLFTRSLDAIANTQTVSLIGRYQLARHSFFNIEAGPMAFRFTRSKDLTSVPYAQLGYAYDARGVHVAVTAGRDFVGAAGYATTIWADYLQAEIGRRFTQQLNLHAGGGVFRNGEAPSRPADIRGYDVSVGGEWHFTPSLHAALGYDRIGQFAGAGDVAGAQLVRTLIGARLIWRTE